MAFEHNFLMFNEKMIIFAKQKFNNMKLFTFLIVFLVSMFGLNAQTYNTIADGDWGDEETWEIGNNPRIPPTSWGTRTININHNVTFYNNSSMQIGENVHVIIGLDKNFSVRRKSNNELRDLNLVSHGKITNYGNIQVRNAKLSENSNIINYGVISTTGNFQLDGSSLFTNYSTIIIGNDFIMHNTSYVDNSYSIVVNGDLLMTGSAIINNSSDISVSNLDISYDLTMWNTTLIINNGNIFVDGNTNGDAGSSIEGTGYICNSDGVSDPTQPISQNIDPNQTICGSPLPVELIYFDLVYENSFLIAKWATASETNNSHFNIYYSTNGKDFIFYDAVEGNGNTNRIIEYSKILNLSLIGELYVKIVQHDFDGKNKSLGIKSAKINNETAISIYPNPVDKNNLVFITGAENYEVFVYELSGKLINAFYCENSECKFDTSNLLSGAYILKLVSKHQTQTLKLLVR